MRQFCIFVGVDIVKFVEVFKPSIRVQGDLSVMLCLELAVGDKTF